MPRKVTRVHKLGPSKYFCMVLTTIPSLSASESIPANSVHFLARQGHAVEVITAPPHYPSWIVKKPYTGRRYAREKINGVNIIRCPIRARGGGRGFGRVVPPLSFAISSAPIVVYRILKTRPDIVLCVEPTLMCGAGRNFSG